MTSRPRLITRLSAAGPLAPDIARGFRAAIATLVPFYFARQLGSRELVWLALGGWFGTLADQGGSRLTRAKTLATFGALGALTLAVCEAAKPLPVVADVVLALVAFTASLVRAMGASASTMGTLVVITAAIASGTPQGNAVRDAAAFAMGAAWAVVLSSIVWPVWTHLRLRIALANAFRELADYVRALDELTVRDVPEHDEAWAKLARVHQRRVRTAIEDARAVALATRARRAGETVLGSNLRMLLGAAESHLPLLIAFAEELESLPVDRRRTAAAALDAIATGHHEIADALAATAVSARTAAAADTDDAPRSEQGVPRAVVLARRLLSSTNLIRPIALAPSSAHPVKTEHRGSGETARRVLREDLQALHDALSVRSTFLRHAVRVTLAVIAAQLAGRMLSLEHSQWVTVTTIAVLQPYPGATVTRAIERVIGTVLGGLVAVAITFTVHSPPLLTLLLVPLSVAAVATRPRSHRLFTFFITPVFVLLAERWQGDWWIAAARAGAAFLGGFLALVAALVFPSREEEAAVGSAPRDGGRRPELRRGGRLRPDRGPGVVTRGRRCTPRGGHRARKCGDVARTPSRRAAAFADGGSGGDAARHARAAARYGVHHARRRTRSVRKRAAAARRPRLRSGGPRWTTRPLVERRARADAGPLAGDAAWVRDAFARILRQSELVGYALAATVGPSGDERAS